MASIINTLLDSNFCIQQISEPKPSDEIIARYPEMKDELRRPIFMMVSATKKDWLYYKKEFYIYLKNEHK